MTRATEPGSPTPFDEADAMCPNCITPWKCNGPHLDEQTPLAARLAASEPPAAEPRESETATRSGRLLSRRLGRLGLVTHGWNIDEAICDVENEAATLASRPWPDTAALAQAICESQVECDGTCDVSWRDHDDASLRAAAIASHGQTARAILAAHVRLAEASQ